MKRKTATRNQNEAGLVSIMVTMFLMVIITLLVIGFAKIGRREQRQTLDKQLSTQAFYAAESGVNDTIQAMKSAPALASAKKTTCDTGPISSALGQSSQLDNTTSYTCIMIDPSPTSLPYDNIAVDSSTVIPINTDGAIVGGLAINWQQSGGGSSYGGCPSLGTFNPAVGGATAWPSSNCDAGVLRLDLVPVSNTARGALNAAAFTTFLYPTTTPGGSVVYAPGDGSNGPIVSGACTAANDCNATITGLGGLGKNFYLRLRSLYRANTVVITANGASGALHMSGAQAMIDSTGKANDVLRRIAVRVDVSNKGSGTPDYAIMSRDTICKRFTVVSGQSAAPDLSGLAVPGTDTANCSPN